MRPTHLRNLSAARRAFVRECQRTDFGEIVALMLQNGEPVFSDQTEVLKDVKLDKEAGPRSELALADFVLPAEFVRLFRQFDAISNGTVKQIEIRAGLPRRAIFKSPTPQQ